MGLQRSTLFSLNFCLDIGEYFTPPIVAGPSFGESFINVVVNGQTVIENLRVVTLETGDIENIKKRIEADEPGILVPGDRYAIIDESRLRETYQTISIQIEAPSDRDVKIIEDPKAPIATTAIGGVCAREFWGPGRVNWYGYTSFFNPWTSEEWGYKPESIDWLAYRADDLASDNIDGLYKRTWGCGIVLKVPDNCTIDITRGSSTYSACCNAFAWYVLGHRIEWVSPGAIKGPNCLN